jgi:hypothetical protein
VHTIGAREGTPGSWTWSPPTAGAVPLHERVTHLLAPCMTSKVNQLCPRAVITSRPYRPAGQFTCCPVPHLTAEPAVPKRRDDEAFLTEGGISLAVAVAAQGDQRSKSKSEPPWERLVSPPTATMPPALST